MNRIVGIGAGGHAEILIEILQAAGCEIVGLLDADEQRHGAIVSGFRVLGGDARLQDLMNDGVKEAFVGCAGFGAADPRRTIVSQAAALGFSFPIITHHLAWCSPSAVIGEGCQILARATVNTSSQVGRHVIVNTGASIDHHCRIGDFAHIAPGAVLAGRVDVGEGAQIGAGAVIKDGVRIGADAVVGAGATVLTDVKPGAVVVGTPAREI